MTKMISKLVAGNPWEARTRDHRAGKRRSNVPVWLNRRIRLAKAWRRGTKMDWEESEGCVVDINVWGYVFCTSQRGTTRILE